MTVEEDVKKLKYTNLGKFVAQLARVEPVVATLQRGDLILIYWIDASTSYHVNLLNNGPLAGHHIETRRENEAGLFVRVQKGPTYHDPHLVILKGNIDTLTDCTISSIPLSLIKKVTPGGKAVKIPEQVERITDDIKESLRLKPLRIKKLSDGTYKVIGD